MTCPQDIATSSIGSSFETLGRDVQCAVSLPDWRSGALQVERLLHVSWDRKVCLLVQSPTHAFTIHTHWVLECVTSHNHRCFDFEL